MLEERKAAPDRILAVAVENLADVVFLNGDSYEGLRMIGIIPMLKR